MNKLKALWNSLPEGVKRVLHTFWQAAAGVLFAGLVTVHSTSDAKLVIAGAVATGLAAVKAYLVSRS